MHRLSPLLIAGIGLAAAACSVGGPSDASKPAHLVENLTVSNGNAYEVDALTAGKLVYTDRKYVFTEVPATWEGVEFIRTANGDKFGKEGNHVSFTVAADATVYVAYDARVKRVPDWLEGWSAADEAIGTNDVARRVYKKTFIGGSKVALGGNLAGEAAGAESNYNVIVRPGL